MSAPRLFYDTALDDGALVASTSAAGYSAANLNDWRPYTWWKPTALPATLTVDCGAARACDYALVYGHTLFSAGCTLEVRGSTDNFSASDVLIATSTPTTDSAVLLQFTAVSYRYWRLRITGSVTMPALAIAAVGTRLELPGYLALDFDPTIRMSIGQTNRNSNGQPLGKVIEYTEQKRLLQIRRVSWAWLRSTFLPAWRTHLRASPFVIAWNAVHDSTNVTLVTAGDELQTPHFQGMLADVSFNIVGAVDDGNA